MDEVPADLPGFGGNAHTPSRQSAATAATPGEPAACSSIDNRRIAKLAKLAGAPEAKAAGARHHVRVDQVVETGQPGCTLHAETPGELHYALAYAASNQDLIGIDPE